MKRLIYFTIAALTYYCIAKVFQEDNAYGIYLGALAVLLTVKVIHLSLDRDRYRDEFRNGRKIVQEYRQMYEPD